MNIPDLDGLPAYADAKEWERLFSLPYGKISRANKDGKLRNTSTVLNRKAKLYQKEHILAWLEIPYNAPPQAPEPEKAMRILAHLIECLDGAKVVLRKFMTDSEKLDEILTTLKRIEERQIKTTAIVEQVEKAEEQPCLSVRSPQPIQENGPGIK